MVVIANAGVIAVLAYLVARVAPTAGVILFLVVSVSVVGAAEEGDRRRRR